MLMVGATDGATRVHTDRGVDGTDEFQLTQKASPTMVKR